MDVLYGLHPVEEAIRSGSRQLKQVSFAKERRDARLEGLLLACRAAGIATALEPRDQLTRMAGTDQHQGVVAMARERGFLSLEDLAAPKADGQHLFLLALDGVEDPHNLGALLRTADGAGVDGVILPERRSAPVTSVVAKTSAGASEHVRIAKVTNLVRSIEDLKRRNIWAIGLDERGDRDYDQFDFRTDCVLVLGREGAGLHDLTRKTCDFLLRIPMAGSVSSLNVSVAGAIVMYEAARQRRAPSLPSAASPPTATAKPKKGLGS